MPRKKKQRKSKSDAIKKTPAIVLYDALMGSIEPELTSDMLQQLEDLYERERPAQTRARMDHYRWAFETFAEMWEEFVDGCREALERFRKEAFAGLKEESTKEDTATLHTLEQQIEIE